MKRRRTAQYEESSTESITSSDETSIEGLQAKVARLQTENDRFQAENDRLQAEIGGIQAENSQLKRTLNEVSGQIVSGKLKGELPPNFLERFRDLSDCPLEKVLQFLPAKQVIEMRYVSRRFNRLIKQCSKTMPKKVVNRMMFDCLSAEELIMRYCEGYCYKYMNTPNEAVLSELLRFFRVDGWIIFCDGAAADWVLDELSKPWLDFCPHRVFFVGDLSQTSVGSLKAFLTVYSPFIKTLHFERVYNIRDGLLNDELFAITNRLTGLVVLPKGKFKPINIGDSTLLSMIDAEKNSFYFYVRGCSGITPGGIRTFVEKMIEKENRRDSDYRSGCKLAFYKCTNVTPETVTEACGNLLEKWMLDKGIRKILVIGLNTLLCPAIKPPLQIHFHFTSFYWNILPEDPAICIRNGIDKDGHMQTLSRTSSRYCYAHQHFDLDRSSGDDEDEYEEYYFDEDYERAEGDGEDSEEGEDEDDDDDDDEYGEGEAYEDHDDEGDEGAEGDGEEGEGEDADEDEHSDLV